MFLQYPVSMVVAMDLLDTIGIDNELPWRCKADLQHFRRLTLGKPCIMGRKTFESLPAPLKQRYVIVLSENPSDELTSEIATLEHHHLVKTVEEALMLATKLVVGSDIMICGGAAIYKAFMPYIDNAYISKINTVIQPVEGRTLVKFDTVIPKTVNVQYTFFELEK